MGVCQLSSAFSLTQGIAIAMIAAAAGVGYVSIKRMVATILNNRQAVDSTNLEMKSIFTGVALVALLLFFLPPVIGFLDNSIDFTSIDEFLSTVEGMLKKTLVLRAYSSDLSSISVANSYNLLIFSFENSWVGLYSSLGQISGRLSIISSRLSSAWSYIVSAEGFLCFSLWVTLKYLLFAGIILRLFPPMSRVGSTLISISLGVILIYPISFLLSFDIASTLTSITPSMQKTVQNAIANIKVAGEELIDIWDFFWYAASVAGPVSYAGPIALTIIGPGYAVPGNIVYDLLMGGIKLVYSIPTISSMSYLEDRYPDVLRSLFSALTELARYTINVHIILILVAFLTVFLTLSAIRSISLLLGGEFFLYGIQERI